LRIISDDNWNVAPEVLVTCAGIDWQNPRAEVRMTPKSI
jgi:hypothetical protein